MAARHIVLIATGRAKADAVQLLEGPMSAMWPATILQHDPHVTARIESGAASRLQLGDFFRSTYAAKPPRAPDRCV
jgi:glucosamine-6-phosphate deaminase